MSALPLYEIRILRDIGRDLKKHLAKKQRDETRLCLEELEAVALNSENAIIRYRARAAINGASSPGFGASESKVLPFPTK